MIDTIKDYFSYGSMRIPALLALPAIPMIVGEWTSLLPLVCHLASQRCESQIVGEIALRGRLYLSLFPRLGVLEGISRFLSNDSDFLDEASSKGGQGDTVYDVNWGSIFPCANGEASRLLIRLAALKAGKVVHFPDFVKADHCRQPTTGHPMSQKESFGIGSRQPTGRDSFKEKPGSPGTAPRFRRYQVLRVIRIRHNRRRQAARPWEKLLFGSLDYLLSLFFLPAVAIVTAIAGAYGTAVILSTSLLTRVICHILQLQVCRPPGYMSNNESGEACMLMAIHQNANVWNLFVGDRGAIDTILNKTMISFQSRGPRSLRFLAFWFRFAHILQLISMTYVAAQKGFDGIFLLVLMLTTWAIEWWGGSTELARKWLEEEERVIDAYSFRFTGRMPLLGTVQQLSSSDEASWLDPIVAKCPRRDLWLTCLAERRKGREIVDDILKTARESQGAPSTVAVNPQWLEMNVALASEGYSLVQRHISASQAPMV
ncbi:MAG: hypothetical protein Q9160_000190 [Pyrenula sp. 1 TL-2023]